MVKCSFCGNEIEKGKGKIFATRIGNISYYCSSKCQRNDKLGRKPKKVRWIVRKKKAKKSEKK
jgi:large subunit ribosomal protein L24e